MYRLKSQQKLVIFHHKSNDVINLLRWHDPTNYFARISWIFFFYMRWIRAFQLHSKRKSMSPFYSFGNILSIRNWDIMNGPKCEHCVHWPQFSKKRLALAITFEVKHFGWRFWCLDLCLRPWKRNFIFLQCGVCLLLLFNQSAIFCFRHRCHT